jgi:MFS family permease
LLGLGLLYGASFAIIKSLFPSPVILLFFQPGTGSEGDFTRLVLVYMGTGLIAGLIAAPVFGGLLLLRRGSRPDDSPASFGARFTLSLGLAVVMGVISGLLILGVYVTGVLPTGGVLDPLSLIQSSNFNLGTPLLVAWTVARDLLPAGLTGLFLAPVGGGALHRLSQAGRPPVQKHYDYEDV